MFPMIIQVLTKSRFSSRDEFGRASEGEGRPNGGRALDTGTFSMRGYLVYPLDLPYSTRDGVPVRPFRIADLQQPYLA